MPGLCANRFSGLQPERTGKHKKHKAVPLCSAGLFNHGCSRRARASPPLNPLLLGVRSHSEFAPLPIVGVTAGVSNGSDQNAFVADDVCDVVRKSGDVDAMIAAAALAPQKRLTNDGRTDALNLGAKPRSQAWNTPLVKPGCLVASHLASGRNSSTALIGRAQSRAIRRTPKLCHPRLVTLMNQKPYRTKIKRDCGLAGAPGSPALVSYL